MSSDVTVNDTGSTVTVTVTETPVYIGMPQSAIDAALALKAPLASPALTGTPTAPTAAADTSTTQIATCAFAKAEADAAQAASQPLDADLTGLSSDYAAATKTLTYNTAKAATSAGLLIENNTGGDVLLLGAGGSQGATFYGQANTVAISDTSASGITTIQASTQDGVRLIGRAGGTGSYVASITPTILSASRTATLPNADITIAGINLAQTWTAAQTISGVSLLGAGGSSPGSQGATAYEAAAGVIRTGTQLRTDGTGSASIQSAGGMTLAGVGTMAGAVITGSSAGAPASSSSTIGGGRIRTLHASSAYAIEAINTDGGGSGFYVQAAAGTAACFLLRNAADTANIMRCNGDGTLMFGNISASIGGERARFATGTDATTITPGATDALVGGGGLHLGGKLKVAGAVMTGFGIANSFAGTTTISNTCTAAGTANYARNLQQCDTTAKGYFDCYSSTFSGSLFGTAAANCTAFLSDGAALSAFFVGVYGVDKPLIFGINASEVARFSSGTLASGSLQVKYTGATALDCSGSVNVATGKVYSVAGTQVVAARKTGWTTATGTATRTSFATGSVTLPALAEAVKALIDDLHSTTGHGLIGT